MEDPFRSASRTAAHMMAAAMRTAPKAGGKDFLEIVIVEDKETLDRIAQRMLDYAPNSTNEAYWKRDAANCAACHALLLVGLRTFNTAGYDCGGCGFPTCAEFVKHRSETNKDMGYSGPHCIMRMMDIGVALSSAAKTASLLNIDNRVQQRVGATARDLGIIHAEVVMGIPIGVFGKSIFFDRSTPIKH
ncbi:MAG: hypothetical protein G8345_07165 [Magnetococcales bacterium]|nr:hypothetical protein [Magnetococcales bacterium]NGZ26652.1 hypothetical protein [Magnetococcales bacterium]